MEEKIVQLSVRELFSKDKYNIPIYQRNYSWTSLEVNQLIQDVIESATLRPESKYYIGNLVVDKRRDNYETIDGQQRITTLFIILCALKNTGNLPFDLFSAKHIQFEHRKNSIKSMGLIFTGDMNAITEDAIKEDKIELHVLDIYKSVVKDLPNLCGKKISIKAFTDYLLDHVMILRIDVPDKIDKNHYFEVMNSRGVQLEQHEIIKAKLTSFLDNSSEAKTFDVIWSACSEMDRFVQKNFSKECREVIFGEDWMEAPDKSFRYIKNAFKGIDNDNDSEKRSLRRIIDDFHSNKVGEYLKNQPEESQNTEQFYPTINFPGLLLQVLKIMKPEKDIPLYDKTLALTFNQIIAQEEDKKKFAKEYIMCLLKCRYLLDTYIIKRNTEDEWGIYSLRSKMEGKYRSSYPVLTFGDDMYIKNDELVLLESMFHFSSPAMNYKNWMNALLTYLYDKFENNEEITDQDMVTYLTNLAKAYMLDWYFCKDAIDFMDIIHNNQGIPQHSLEDIDEDFMKSVINNGTAVDSFIFNFYDYIIWKENPDKKNFHFTYRTSVEHFYPQHPTGGEFMSQDGPYLNSFGNLCLISNSMNSKFTNKLPTSKYTEYSGDEKVRNLSLKLQEMFDTVHKNKNIEDKFRWYHEDIEAAEKLAIERFKNALRDETV